MLLTIVIVLAAVISVTALELWLFWRLGERDERRDIRARADIHGAPARRRGPSTSAAVARKTPTGHRRRSAHQVSEFAGLRGSAMRDSRRPAWTPPRPPRSWRSPGEREVIRRKTFALEPMRAATAAEEMAAPDQDFYLFREAESDVDAVLYLRYDGHCGLIEPRIQRVPVRAEGRRR